MFSLNQTNLHKLWSHGAKPYCLTGSVIQAPLNETFVGERCFVQDANGNHLAWAQTIGFNEKGALMSLIGSNSGVSRAALVVPSGKNFELSLSDNILGTVIDSEGNYRGQLKGANISKEKQDFSKVSITNLSIEKRAPEFSERKGISTWFETGIRAIDSLLSCGIGQRVGIFAPAGGGKTSLLSMLVAHSNADVFVIGLVGERGREVAEFVEGAIATDKAKRTVVVYATSDSAPLERRNAALVATTVAEYFRDQGKHVLLLVDSMTRYARALRDVALSAGEAPARRGYPASVFEALPKLLERSGHTKKGAITAFYTVLLEDDEQDPIGDEVRSILDGHIYLSKTLAARGHFPAIDILRSASRVASHIADNFTLERARVFRSCLAKLDELQLVVDLGEYRPGENPETDALFSIKPAMFNFLQQRQDESSSLTKTLEQFNVVTQKP